MLTCSGPTFRSPQAAAEVPSAESNWRSFIERAKSVWLSFQVSHRGQYSIERLVALNDYWQHTSWTRVLLVCLGTPLPVIALVLSQEAVPLQDPSDGWRENYGIWVRGSTLSGVVAHTILVQLKHLVEGAALSSMQVGAIVTAVMLCYTIVCTLVAANIVFPIPFMSITMTTPFLVILAVAFLFIAGSPVVREIQIHKEQLIRFVAFLTAQTLMSVIYPAYQVLFEAAANTGYELVVVALLPVIKIALKNIVALTFKRMDDMMPEAVIFTVDFFNSFYIATSMQTASSITTVVVIMATDPINTFLALKALHYNTATVARQLSESQYFDGNSEPCLGFDLIEAACSLCRRSFEAQDREQIQLRSCISYRTSPDIKHVLDQLGRYSGYCPSVNSCSTAQQSQAGSPTANLTMKKKSRLRWARRWTSIVKPIVRRTKRPMQATQDEKIHTMGRSLLLQSSLKIFFTSECIVLAEYLESFVPVLYANYILVMAKLPSRAYHNELAGVDDENVGAKIQVIFVYALVEILSFLLLAIVMQRNCGIRTLYHLAFVLETHMPLIQGKLMSWILLTLATRVVHFGVDFTFQFSWV